jgi:VWFA-related protein
VVLRIDGPTRGLAVALIAGVAAVALRASPPATAEPLPLQAEPPVFGVQTSTVELDVVVRDKKGRPMRDLQAADFEVFEDGVRQTVDSFRVVDNPAARDAAPEASEAPSAAPTDASMAPSGSVRDAAGASNSGAPAVVAFVFDRLSANARQTAHKAALAYTEGGYVSGDLVGVFAIDLALRTLQPFTSDVVSIQAGLRLAGAQANTVFASERDESRRRTDEVARADETLASLGGSASSSTPTIAGLVAAQQLSDQMQANMLRSFDALERDQQGFATTHGLLAVVNSLKALPGRKTVVFFSEGIAIPTGVEAQFRSVIASANRANVSIYAVDASGLRTESGAREAREEMLQGVSRRLRQEELGHFTGREGALNRQLERNEDILRLNPESGLGQLADETGGFLVHDTNDMRSGFGRIAEDMRFHYLLSYAPTNEKLDGQFRTISVKLRRPDVRVQTRKGYFAVRPAFVVPLRAYEAPAVAQLDLEPRPDAFALGVAALSFPEAERPGLVPILVSVPGPAVSWVPDPASGFRADFSVVVRIKDARGREADRVSQEYRLSAPADKLETARRGDILFYREANLPAGRYTADAVAYDALAGTASVRSAAFEVPPVRDKALRLSSLVLVSRAEKVPVQEQPSGNPLQFGEAMLYPNLGGPFRKVATPAMGFFFSVYGSRSGAPAKATIELRQGTRTLATLPAELPEADASGRIQYAGALPLQSLPPGDFTLRVSVTDGAADDARETPFTVE